MKVNDKTRKKKLLALFLSALMAASVTMAFSACDDEEETTDNSTGTEEETDDDVVLDEDELIANGTFKLDKYNEAKPIVTNVTGWGNSTTNSVSSGVAPSSDAASGVIDIADDKWADLTQTGIDVLPSELTEEQAAEKWENMTTRDKLEYYSAWKSNTDNKNKSISDLEFYESFNIDVDDLPLIKDDAGNKTAVANPGACPDSETGDSRILMLHNEKTTDNYRGTAQKFTSASTVTVKAGETAKFSVWVKTSNLVASSANNEEDTYAVNKGAYIRVTHSVGGKALDPLEIKNINTAGVTENNGWVEYEFLLRGSYFADSTFSLVLGLGQSGGSNKEEYVNGYAFFDGITCNVEKSSASLPTDYTEFNMNADPESKVQEAKNVGTKFALDFYAIGNGFAADNAALDAWTVKPTTEKNTSGQIYTSVSPEFAETNFSLSDTKVWPSLGAGLQSNDDLFGKLAISSLNGKNATATAVYKKYFANDDFLGDKDALVFLSKNGAAYSAEKSITVPKGYSAISFFVKTSAMNSYVGAGTNLTFANKNYNTAYTINSIDTTTVVKDDSDTDGWQQVFYFFNNESDSAQTATLRLSFGPTTIINSTFYEGFAAFAGFTSNNNLSKEEFECAANGSYTKLVVLSGDVEESQSDSGFDAAGSLKQASIEDGFAKAKNYTGVYNDSAFIGGKDLSSNALKTAGLINKKYADNYADIFNALGGSNWNDTIGASATQPLIIYNETSSDKTYGFIGNTMTISAKSYKTISMRVKVSNTTANIYLVDMSNDGYNSTLSIGRRVTYWYDANGNVCAKDPNDKENFHSKTDVAFKLQKNGLYKVNPYWSGAEGVDTEAYFANLAAYAYDEDSGNLMLDSLALDYEYNDNWKHDGNDRVAFYSYNKENKTAFAYSDKTTLVYDFSTVSALAPRYTALEENKDLQFSIPDTNGEWVTVTFYVHAGESAKNYRLELWNGARSGGTMNANSFVMFDSWSPSDLNETSWNTLLNGLEDTVSGNKNFQGVYDKFESTYSFYDSAKYLRYDETIDENDAGNSFKSYDATSAKETTAFLRYEEGDVYQVFADYATLETNVPVDTENNNSSSSDEEESNEDDTNAWLLGSSITVAAVLVLAVVSLIVRKIVTRIRKKRGTYVEKVKKPRKVKKAKEAKKNK